MLKRRIDKLEKDNRPKDKDSILAVIFKKSNMMKISELSFIGTIAEGRKLLEKHGSNYIIVGFNVSRPG